MGDGPIQKHVHQSVLAIPGPHAKAPHRPHVEIIDQRDDPAAGEARIASRMHSRPADGLIFEISDDAGCGVVLAQLAHALGPRLPSQRDVLLAADAIAQAEADIGCRILRPDQRRNVIEDSGRAHLDAHGVSVAQTMNDVDSYSARLRSGRQSPRSISNACARSAG